MSTKTKRKSTKKKHARKPVAKTEIIKIERKQGGYSAKAFIATKQHGSALLQYIIVAPTVLHLRSIFVALQPGDKFNPALCCKVRVAQA